MKQNSSNWNHCHSIKSRERTRNRKSAVTNRKSTYFLLIHKKIKKAGDVRISVYSSMCSSYVHSKEFIIRPVDGFSLLLYKTRASVEHPTDVHSNFIARIRPSWRPSKQRKRNYNVNIQCGMINLYGDIRKIWNIWSGNLITECKATVCGQEEIGVMVTAK
jgi:hypothetical protein